MLFPFQGMGYFIGEKCLLHEKGNGPLTQKNQNGQGIRKTLLGFNFHWPPTDRHNLLVTFSILCLSWAHITDCLDKLVHLVLS